MVPSVSVASVPFGDPVEKTEAALANLRRYEPQVSAFVTYDAKRARAQARKAVGPLAGLTLGIKDIIDTHDFATEYGSTIYEGYRPRADAVCVTLLESAGAVAIGKTVTTEFAFFRPGKTHNPYNLAHTPGGSSSGSAAAVACGMVDIALGSQTAASLTRPASYCGVVGFKPTYGSYSSSGVKALAPSFDSLGMLGTCVQTVAAAHAVLLGPLPQPPSAVAARAPRRIGICRTPWWNAGNAGMHDAFNAASDLLAAEVSMEVVDLSGFSNTVDLHARIMSYEAAQSLAWEYRHRREWLSPQIVNLIEVGRQVDLPTYRAALAAAADARGRIGEVFEHYDLLLAPAAPGEAPHGLAATGDPVFSRMWTLLHLPTVTLPGMQGPQGLPVGVQLLARAGADASLFAQAAWAEKLLPLRPKPRLPELSLDNS